MGARKLIYDFNELPLQVVYKSSNRNQKSVQRFLSVDPLAHKFASWSPYNYVMGNPIMLIDPTGKEANDIIISKVYKDGNGREKQFSVKYENGKLYDKFGKIYKPIEGGYIEKVQNDLILLQTSGGERARNLINTLQNSESTHYITNDNPSSQRTGDFNLSTGTGGGTITQYNPFKGEKLDLSLNIPYPEGKNRAITLSHELTHAFDVNQHVPDSYGHQFVNGIKRNEIHAVDVENSVRRVLGEPLRRTYGKGYMPKELLNP